MKKITLVLNNEMPKINAVGEAMKVFLKKHKNYKLEVFGDEKTTNFLKDVDNIEISLFDDEITSEEALVNVFEKRKTSNDESPIIYFGNKDLFVKSIKEYVVPQSTPALMLPAHTKLFNKYTLFLDCGATIGINEEILKDYYKESTLFIANSLGIKNPKIGILNHKYLSDPSYQRFSSYLKETIDNKYISEISSKDVLEAKVDILIGDSNTMSNVIDSSIGTRNTIDTRYNEEIEKSSIFKFLRWNLKSVNTLMIKLFDTGLEVNGYYLLGYSFDIGLLQITDGYKELMNCFDFIQTLQIKK